jgi:hypothetical protein
MLVSYEKTDGIAKISMDDGKVNVMSVAMLSELTAAFERAERDGVIVILTSAREGIFSAGFDTKILANKDPQEVFEMVRLGAELAVRVLAFPRPVVTACPGHAYPMGAFLLLASDVRIGADGPYRIGLNEVAIGIPVPTFGLELARDRLLPAYLHTDRSDWRDVWGRGGNDGRISRSGGFRAELARYRRCRRRCAEQDRFPFLRLDQEPSAGRAVGDRAYGD